ncbi:hypothetical protein ACJZ2D_005015 [Fusarium nematophilum]
MSDSPVPTSTIISVASEPTSSTISPLLVALGFISAIFRFIFSFNWLLLLTRAFHVFAFPFRLILFPLSLVANLLLVLFAPAIYIASYSLAGLRMVFAFFASLEFGAAAGVGIFAGIALAISSSLITSYLGMQDDDDDMAFEGPASRHSLLLDTSSHRDSSGTDIDWQWLDSPGHRRRPAAGLLSQTIHEEDDDSEY